jgi:conjugal transfer mating pair stabilization protein TraN
MKIYRDCWDFSIAYACIIPEKTNTCTDLIARGGSLAGSSCVSSVYIDDSYRCITEEHQYNFIKRPAYSTTTKDCSSQQFCIDGRCFDTGSEPDPDFNKAVTGMEGMREAAVYADEASLTLFRGNADRCPKTVLKNCCKGTSTSISGLNNLAVYGGSRYAYDVLVSGKSAFAVGFDPTSFALGVAYVVITEMIKCDKGNALLAVKRDKGLCHYVGQYCSKKLRLGFAKICIQHSESYCCFNSKLSRMINEAARVQIPGLGWGSPEGPNCSGLTVEQFERLDFEKIDLSEFYSEISPTLPDVKATTDASEKKVKCYFHGEC